MLFESKLVDKGIELFAQSGFNPVHVLKVFFINWLAPLPEEDDCICLFVHDVVNNSGAEYFLNVTYCSCHPSGDISFRKIIIIAQRRHSLVLVVRLGSKEDESVSVLSNLVGLRTILIKNPEYLDSFFFLVVKVLFSCQVTQILV